MYLTIVCTLYCTGEIKWIQTVVREHTHSFFSKTSTAVVFEANIFLPQFWVTTVKSILPTPDIFIAPLLPSTNSPIPIPVPPTHRHPQSPSLRPVPIIRQSLVRMCVDLCRVCVCVITFKYICLYYVLCLFSLCMCHIWEVNILVILICSEI